MPRDIRMLLHDVVESARAIEVLTAEASLAKYRRARWLRSSVEREFITIGEALRRAAQIDPSIEQAFPDLPRIVGFRNNLVHR